MEKDTLKDDLEDFSLCVEAESEQRKESQDDLEFGLLGKQWSEDDLSARKGRPCLTINRLPSFGKHVTNDGRINRPSINVKPVGGGADKATADIQSDLIRNIETQSQASIVYDTAFHFAVHCGFGYFRINVDYTEEDAWDQDIFLQRIANPFCVYGDYDSTEATSIDWNRAYVTDWVSKAAFEAKWGKDKKAGSFNIGSKDFDATWFKDKRIRVAERWLREEVETTLLRLSNGEVLLESEWLKDQDFFLARGLEVADSRPTKSHKVRQRIITGTDILEENDWLGKYIPIVPMYGEEVNVNGKRYFISLIRRAKDPQRMLNYWRSASTELVALAPKAPWIGAVGQFTSDPHWQTANTENHPYLEYDTVDANGTPVPPPQRQPFAGVPAGALQEALNASDDMKAVTNIYDASLGARSNETSGKAISARDRQGDIATFDFVDNRNRSVEHGGRIILDLIPRLYTAERILRCVQEDGSTYTVPVNQPVAPRAALDKLMQAGIPQPIGAPMQPGMMAPPMPMMGQDSMQPGQQDEQQGPPEYVPIPPEAEGRIPPEQLQAITKIFDLTTGKYDVMVTTGPGFNTRREEAATQMMEFIRIFPQAAPLIGDLLAKNLDWPGSEQVAERLKAMLPPQAAGKINPMVAQLQGMLRQQDAQAKQAVATLQKQIGDLMAQVKDKSVEQQTKMQEVGVKRYEAETRRAEVLKPEMQQQQLPPDPIKVTELELERRRVELDAYSAETERLKVLGATIAPEQIVALVNQTVMQAMMTKPGDAPACGDTPMPPMMDAPMMDAGPPGAMQMMQEPPRGGFFAPAEPEIPMAGERQDMGGMTGNAPAEGDGMMP